MTADEVALLLSPDQLLMGRCTGEPAPAVIVLPMHYNSRNVRTRR